MANSSGVWGIEIGQSALKAMRCSVVDDQVTVDAFDFIEYPKILSQPEAVAEELVADALATFVEHNGPITDKVVISVPGQSGLAKFFKPPPVEVKKISDLVRYEARQQIPFDLADVIWDFQLMPGSMVEEGYALESEVGLFAMKREQAYRQLAPFDDAEIEVDTVQLAPIALYNMLAFDRMHERLETEVFDADNPPDSSVILSIGTDSSDLIVTNGFRIWQRSMPIGGNHFTRQLTKDLKLTFAKAEHLKRNAREAVDPKLIFQTMRPVFNDLVTEVQRSIGFFRSIDKQAEISDLIVTGNTVKMPGLAAYLGKNLGYEVHVLDRFSRLGGEDVLSIPTFRDNSPTFAVCYGLCLQGLGLSQVHSSLVPQEILTKRMIRAKKPWALAGMAAMLIGMATNFTFVEINWAKSHEDVWKKAGSAVSAADSYATEHKNQDNDLNSQLTYLNELGKQVSGNAERRLPWLEILRALNTLIPRGNYEDGAMPSHKELPYEDRIDFHISEVESQHFEDLKTWYTDEVKLRMKDEMTDWSNSTKKPIPAHIAVEEGPSGAGWVLQFAAHHYFNSIQGEEAGNHVRKYLTTAFLEKKIELPDPRNPGQTVVFTPLEMGITYPLLLDDNPPVTERIANPDYDPQTAQNRPMGGNPFGGQVVIVNSNEDKESEDEEPAYFEVERMDFIFQFVWQPKTLEERLKAQEEAQKAAAEAEAAAAADATVAMQ